MRPKKLISLLFVLAILIGVLTPANLSSVSAAPDGDQSDSSWTDIQPSADSKLIYVSSSEGDDNNDGLSQETPVKTIAKAQSLIRDGYPDWILFKRGDVWKDETLGKHVNGRSPDEPTVVTYYGDSGARPLFKVNVNFLDHDGDLRNYQSFIGLHILNYKMDPKDPEFIDRDYDISFRIIGSGDSILVEDCKFQYIGIGIQSYHGSYTNLKLRRNIILDTYNRGSTTDRNSRVSGIYVSGVDGLLIEENVIDHNGWSDMFPDSLANMYNHNVYIQTDNIGNRVVFRGNIVTRGSSHGVHGRPGGLYEDNLFVENSVNLQMGYRGTPLKAGTFAIARNNVILQGKRMQLDRATEPASGAVWGLYLDDLGEGDVTVENNIVANRKESGGNTGIQKLSGVTYANNIQYQWGGGIGDMNDAGWLDPTRSVGSYHGTLGKTPTLEAFLDVVRNRGAKEWPQEYTAYVVNNYIREGFTLDPSKTIPTATPSSKPAATSEATPSTSPSSEPSTAPTTSSASPSTEPSEAPVTSPLVTSEAVPDSTPGNTQETTQVPSFQTKPETSAENSTDITVEANTDTGNTGTGKNQAFIYISIGVLFIVLLYVVIRSRVFVKK